MPKAKDGSECYTRINKSGGKYITCEGTQKGNKGKKMKKEDEVRPVDKKVPKLGLRQELGLKESSTTNIGGYVGKVRELWKTIKDLKWNPTVKSKIIRNFDSRQYIIKNAEIKKGKFIITYILTKEMAEHLYDEPDEIKKAMTKPSKSSYTIPKAQGGKEIDFKKIKDILKKSAYREMTTNGFRTSMRIKDNKLFVGTFENDIEKLIKDTDKLFKNNKLVYDNVIFMTDSYPPNPKTGKQDGVYRKPKMIFKGETLK
tara:strand:- start:297 stop:1067 length:771 start_codon:yes stop_codon:yes gene_type:complete